MNMNENSIDRNMDDRKVTHFSGDQENVACIEPGNDLSVLSKFVLKKNKHQHYCNTSNDEYTMPSTSGFALGLQLNKNNSIKKRPRADSGEIESEKNSKHMKPSHKRAKSALGNTYPGIVYQNEWLTAAALEAKRYNGEITFQTEVSQGDAGKLDDILIEYRYEQEKSYNFIQAKYKIVKNDKNDKKITLANLLRKPRSDKPDERPFAIEKYFTSYRDKIKPNPKYRNDKGQELVANFIVVTNNDFAEDFKKQFGPPKTNIPFLEKIKNCVSKEPFPMYWNLSALNSNEKEMIANQLERTYDLIKLANRLAKSVLDDQFVILADDFYKPYAYDLIENVIDIHENKFKSSFINNRNLTCVEAENLREAFLYEGFTKENKSLALHCSYKLSRPEKLANIIADKIIQAIKKNNSRKIEKKLVIRRDENTKIFCIDELADFVLIENNGIRFNRKFLTAIDDALPHESLKIFREKLKLRLQTNNVDDITFITELKFDINNFKTCRKMLVDETCFWEGVRSFDKFEIGKFKTIRCPQQLPHLPSENLLQIKSDISKFFNYLVFAVSFSRESLTEYFAQYFQEYFNLEDNEVLVNHFRKEVSKALDLTEETYPSNSEEVSKLLEKMEKKVAKQYLVGYTTEYKSEMQKMGISFNEQAADIMSFLSSQNKQVFNLINRHSTKLSAFKVYEALKDTCEYQRNDGYISLKLSTALRLQPVVIKGFMASRLLLIECENVSENLNAFWNELKKILSFGDKKLILISPSEKFFDRKFIKNFFGYSKYVEKLDSKICITDLSVAVQDKLLKKKNVLFQGERVHVDKVFSDGETKRLIRGKELLKLIENKYIQIGKPVTDTNYDDIKEYFIKRSLNHIEIKKEFRANENDFHILEPNKHVATEPNTDQDIVIITDSGEYFRKHCHGYENQNVHWIKKQSKYVWQQSQGAVLKLRKFVDKGSVSKIGKITDSNNKFVVIAAEPGMGKSIFLTHLAVETKRVEPTLWIVRINLHDYLAELFQNPPLNRLNAVKFVYNTLGFKALQNSTQCIEISLSDDGSRIHLPQNQVTDNEDNLIQAHLFNHYYSKGMVALLFDGFDEISPKHKTTVLNMLKTLRDTKFSKIWVSTRPYDFIQNELEDSLGVFSYTLKPFLLKDQTEFLAKFWKIKCACLNFTRKRAEIFIKELQNSFPRTIGDEKKNFMSTPLHALMVAEVFQETFKNLYDLNEKEFIAKIKENIDGLNILELYNKFFERKLIDKRLGIDISHALGDKEREKHKRNHEQLAIYAIFEKKLAERLFFQTEQEKAKITSLIEDIKKGNDKLGIVARIVDEKPRFVHETFAEFFAACYLWNKFKITERLNDFIKEVIIEVLIKNSKIQICKFFLLCGQEKLDRYTEVRLDTLLSSLISNENVDISGHEGAQPIKILLGFLQFIDLPAIFSRITSQRQLQLLYVCAEMGYEKAVHDLSKIMETKYLRTSLGNSSWELSPLWLAAENGYVDIAKIISNELSYNISWKDKHEMTLIQRIFELDNFHVLRSCMSLEIINSADLNSDNFSALVHCLENNAPQNVIELLIESVDINFINDYENKGKLASHLIRCDDNVTIALLQKGVDFSKYLHPLLSYYMERTLIVKKTKEKEFDKLFSGVKLLLENGVAYNYIEKTPKTAELTQSIHKLLRNVFNLCKLKKDKAQSIFNTMLTLMLKFINHFYKNYKIAVEANTTFITAFKTRCESSDNCIIEFPSSFLLNGEVTSPNHKKYKLNALFLQLGLKEVKLNKNLRQLVSKIAKSNLEDILTFLLVPSINLLKVHEKNMLSALNAISKYCKQSSQIFSLLQNLDNLFSNFKNDNYVEVTKILGNKHADTKSLVNGQDKDLGSLLHLAVIKKNIDIAKLLIQKGARIDARDKYLRTPLHYAVQNGLTDLVELLLNNKASSSERDKTQKTPLDLAKDNISLDPKNVAFNQIIDLLPLETAI